MNKAIHKELNKLNYERELEKTKASINATGNAVKKSAKEEVKIIAVCCGGEHLQTEKQDKTSREYVPNNQQNVRHHNADAAVSECFFFVRFS